MNKQKTVDFKVMMKNIMVNSKDNSMSSSIFRKMQINSFFRDTVNDLKGENYAYFNKKG